MRLLLVTCDPYHPAPTPKSSNGNRLIRAGLAIGLRDNHAVPGIFCASRISSERREEFEIARDTLRIPPEHFWCDQPSRGPQAIAALRNAVKEFRPDALLCYGWKPAKLARQAAPDLLIGIMSVDLEHAPILLRLRHNLRYGDISRKIISAVDTTRKLTSFFKTKHNIRKYYPLADFIINHSAAHAEWHRNSHQRPTLYVPIPVPALECKPVRCPTSPARFIMIGGVRGIATLVGLVWFARHVYPLIEPAIIAKQLEIHIIGKGELEYSIRAKMPLTVMRGFIPDLKEELAAATALLVPTPIELGTRTRILDAFRHALPVIVHSANTAGMPQLRNGQNAIVTDSGRRFAEAVLDFAADGAKAERLGQCGYNQFCTDLNATAVTRQILEFIRAFKSNANASKRVPFSFSEKDRVKLPSNRGLVSTPTSQS